ncbi:COX15/CtaA family protein [Chryseosolibacter indicus]|uniref:COX15/CtaA family protein n=1 Tax=Chryseosolibacter indicus TaxID=2782351 RepID=A0ABS5VUX7_9BACT|nr:COX15/CtaA family protein [Chryseosolibacter indicus]MBT1705238.1 COX15/CtaA family protein [Chryseosolibacter indicus]
MRSFRRLSIGTLVAVYVLIMVGGIVRSTGSGMGCPDWPRCFGSWVPPTSVKELPENYKEIYADYRHKKNVKFSKYLNFIGLSETGEKILTNESILEEGDFNPTKTLIEYVNRIIGVIIGFLIFAVFVSSLKFWRSQRMLTIVALLTFLLVGFQGWIGSFVVSTNLTPWTVTVHMFLAIVIVALLIYLVDQCDYDHYSIQSPVPFWLLLGCIVTLLIQILLGTQVREAIDLVASTTERSNWLTSIGTTFTIHRSFSWLVLILHVGLILILRKTKGLKAFPLTLILLILGTILTGISMAWFAIPSFLQPVHLVLATICFGVQFMLLLKLNRKEEPVLN